eukprot:2012074-Amphidinium_carterae.1
MQRHWKGTLHDIQTLQKQLRDLAPPRRTATAPQTPRASVDTMEIRGFQRGTHHEEISSQVAEIVSRCEEAVRTNLERTRVSFVRGSEVVLHFKNGVDLSIQGTCKAHFQGRWCTFPKSPAQRRRSALLFVAKLCHPCACPGTAHRRGSG